jgi:hypothetical protein
MGICRGDSVLCVCVYLSAALFRTAAAAVVTVARSSVQCMSHIQLQQYVHQQQLRAAAAL